MAPVACGVRQGTGPRKYPLGGTEEGHGISHGPQSSPPMELWRKAPSSSSQHQGWRVPSQTRSKPELQKAAIGPSQAQERGGIPRKAFGQNRVRVGQAQHLLGGRGGSLSPAFSKSKESAARNSDLGAGDDCLGSDLFYFPLRKPL